MPDIRKHRGAHPDDRKVFAASQLPKLRTAVAELSWLLTREYAMKSALKLVGDKFRLNQRQRLAISRAACSNKSQRLRRASELAAEQIAGRDLVIDGFNLLITVEAALSKGLLLLCRDGCIRDLSSVHGSYQSVNETEGALRLIGNALAALKPNSVGWILDQPVSNSGRLAKKIRDLAGENGWPWQIETAFNPDRAIISSRKLVVSADGPLLDEVHEWLNLARRLIEKNVDAPWLIDLS